MVMKEAKRLKGTRFSIDRDYPSEITEAGKKLWPEVKRLREIPGQNVQLRFPARTVLSGQITKDAFPHWDETLKSEIMKDFRFILQGEQAARVLFSRNSAPFCQAASQEGAPVSTHMPGNIDRQSESMNGASGNHVNFIPHPPPPAPGIAHQLMTHDVNRPGQTAQSRGISRDSMEIFHSQYSQDVNNRVESQRRNSVTVSNEHAAATASPRMETPHSVSEADLSPSQPSPSLLPQGPVNAFARGIGSCAQNTQDKAANAPHSRPSSRQSDAVERPERSTSRSTN